MADPRVQPATSKTPAARRKPDSKPDSKHPLQPEPQSFATAPDERAVASLADLTRLASAYLTEDDIRRIRDAYRVSDEAHLGNFRSTRYRNGYKNRKHKSSNSRYSLCRPNRLAIGA